MGPGGGHQVGEVLTGHAGHARWGVWGRVRQRPTLATGGGDGAVRLWDAATGNALGEGAVRLWDAAAQAALGQPLADHPGEALWGAWGSLGKRAVLATGSLEGGVRLWWPRVERAPVEVAQMLNGQADDARWGVWRHGGGRPVLATGGRDGLVRLWDPEIGNSWLTGHQEWVRWGAWGDADGRSVLATGDLAGSVRLWDPVAGAPLGGPLHGHVGDVRWGEWGRVGGRSVLATGGADGTVRLWDPSARAQLGEPLTGHVGDVRWGAWGQVGGRSVLATGGGDGTVRLWDPSARAQLGESLTGHTGLVRWGAWASVAGRPVLATGGYDGVRLWEIVEDRPVPRLPGYRSDAAPATDELARTADAVAVAELITARSARPPLAVGLFGDWGEGKSHFLGLLQQHVQAVAQPTNVLAHSAVRQVQFNAWHYAETDLWASLIAELFAQLVDSATGDPGAEQRRQSRLTAELVAGRGLSERLHAARERRDQLRHALREPAGAWDALPHEQQAQLRALAGERPEEVFREAARTVTALQGSGRLAWRLVRGVPLRTFAFLAGVLTLFTALAIGLVWGLPPLWKAVAALPGGVGAAAGVLLCVRFARATRAKGSAAWQTAQRIGRQQRERTETAANVADAEVDALERQLQNLTAAGQLAGLVAERAASGDYRSRLGLMTQIREDFRHMADLLAEAAASDVRDAANARDPLDTPDALDPEADNSRAGARSRLATRDEAGDALPRIDRIIIYIDDLDRCAPRRVVEVLEAIHLLLAVDLFVVIVAVDPRWLLRALTAHYRELMDPRPPLAGQAGGQGAGLGSGHPAGQTAGPVDPDDEELWRSTPAQYLEKIFQVVLTLPPLDTSGYLRLVHTLVGTRADRPAPEPAGAPQLAGQSVPVTPAASAGPPAPDDDYRAVGGGALSYGTRLPAARVIERVDPLTLEPDELALLNLLGPPLLVSTPRAVKRLANSYGLLTAIRREQRAADLTAHTITLADSGQLVTYFPYWAGMVLLSALIAYPALGPALFLHLHHTAEATPHLPWAEFRETLVPREQDGRWRSPADPDMTPVQAQQWQALLRGLSTVESAAAERELSLPVPLLAWAQWVIPVGRLSFPTGRIVSALDRQRPLSPGA